MNRHLKAKKGNTFVERESSRVDLIEVGWIKLVTQLVDKRVPVCAGENGKKN